MNTINLLRVKVNRETEEWSEVDDCREHQSRLFNSSTFLHNLLEQYQYRDILDDLTKLLEAILSRFIKDKNAILQHLQRINGF